MAMAELDLDVNSLQSHLGIGRFQIISFLVLGLVYSRGAWHVFGIMFLAGDPGHKCVLPKAGDGVHSVLSYLNESSNTESRDDEDWPKKSTSINVDSIPARATTTINIRPNMLYSFQHVEIFNGSTSNWTAESCAVSYITTNGSSLTVGRVEECPYGWTYGSEFETTVLSEWDLVCDNNFLVELSITVFMAGSAAGAMIILPLADRFGRKPVMMASLLCQAIVGTTAAFANSYVLFTVLRCIVGMLNIGANLSAYVLLTESFPAKQRTVMSLAFQVFWAFGVMTVAGFGFLVRHWRHLEMLLSLPSILAVPCIWLLPESLPWLVSQKQWKKVIATVTMIAKVNGKGADEIIKKLHVGTFHGESTAEYISLQTSMEIHRANDEETAQSQNGDLINCADQVDQQISNEMTSRPEAILNGKVSLGLSASITSMESKSLKGKNSASCGVDSVYQELMPKPVPKSTLAKKNSLISNGCQHGLLNEKPLQGQEQPNVPDVAESHSIMDLFRHRRLRLYSCSMFFLFFVNSLGYFGISFSVPVLHGDPFINLAIMGAVEIPANLLCILISQRAGRRYPNAMFLLLCGVTNIVRLFIPSSLVVLKLSFVMVGKFAITAAYSTIYLYSAEIFPTAVRNQGMGLASVFENIGSISAPFIVHAAKSIAELPLVVFGSLSIIGAGLTLLLPETHNKPLPQTVEEIKTW